MTTALDLITDALSEIGVIGVGQSVPAEDAALSLRYLNRMVQRWSNTQMMMPVVAQVSVTLNGALSYTIGPSGADVTAARPISVVGAYSEDAGGIRYDCDVLSRQEWNAIGDPQTAGGPPDGVYYERTAGTTGRIYTHPKSTGYTLKLDCLSLITSYTLLTSVTLPPGYESAIVLSLAEDLCGPFGKRADLDLKMRAKGARMVVKRTNAEPLLLKQELAAGEEYYEIERGY